LANWSRGMNKSLPPLAKIDSGSNCHGWTIYMLDTPLEGLRPFFGQSNESRLNICGAYQKICGPLSESDWCNFKSAPNKDICSNISLWNCLKCQALTHSLWSRSENGKSGCGRRAGKGNPSSAFWQLPQFIIIQCMACPVNHSNRHGHGRGHRRGEPGTH